MQGVIALRQKCLVVWFSSFSDDLNLARPFKAGTADALRFASR